MQTQICLDCPGSLLFDYETSTVILNSERKGEEPDQALWMQRLIRLYKVLSFEPVFTALQNIFSV